MRAISSPTLSETLPVKQHDELKHTADAIAVTVGTGSGSVTGSSSSAGGGSVSGGTLGVLQQFKRTLRNLNNRNQLQITPMPGAGAGAAGAISVDGKSSPTTPTVSITAPAAAAASGTGGSEAAANATTPAEHAAVDSSSAKYRFGPLIWRSSKERRKTKFNRRDKCNSGDSGIQIELEQDEQYVRALTAGTQPVGVAGGTSTPLNRSSTPIRAAELKARTIRRTHSAKAASILDQAAAAAKPPVHKQLDLGSACSIEREAPESLPTRSLSQPNGLETYGMRRNDIEDSDSDSVASHEEGEFTLCKKIGAAVITLTKYNRSDV